MWRYKEFLPVTGEAKRPKLRVGWSPLYKSDRLAEQLGIKELYIKDDGINPTASLKDRASAMAVVKAEEAGVDTIACSSTGNAASSLAGNSAAAGFKTYIFVPERAPKGKVSQLMISAPPSSVSKDPTRTHSVSPQKPLNVGDGTIEMLPSTLI